MPQGEDLRAVSGGAGQLLVAGARGMLLIRRDERWQREVLPTIDTVVATWGPVDGSVHAATRGGWILRRDDAGWQVVRRDAGRPRAMWGHGDQLFVVGDDGAVLRHDDAGWHRDELAGDLRAVDGHHAERVFAVGDAGRVYRWDGWDWQPWTTPTTRPLERVWVGPSLVIVASADRTWVHNGERWHRSLAHGAVGCWGRSSVVRCMLRNGEIWFMRHGIWKRHGAPMLRTPLAALWSGDGRQAFAVGDRGAVFHFNRRRWVEISRGHDRALRGVWGSGPRDVWAVGDEGVIMRSNGDGWRVVLHLATVQPFNDIWGSGPDDIYAVGGQGLVAHFDGERWVTSARRTDADLHAVWGSGRDDVYAVGADGAVLHFDGSDWRVFKRGDGRLEAVTGSGDRIWALGVLGEGYRADPRGWTALRSAPSRDACTLSGQLLAVGHRTLRHDGDRWHEEERPLERLDGVWCGQTHAYAVGSGGAIFRRAASGQWHQQQSGTRVGLHDVWGVDDHMLWAVGDRGAILRRRLQ